METPPRAVRILRAAVLKAVADMVVDGVDLQSLRINTPIQVEGLKGVVILGPDELLGSAAAVPDDPTATINERMTARLRENQDAAAWSVGQWAEYLGCSKSSVHGTPMWTALMQRRQANRDQRASREDDE